MQSVDVLSTESGGRTAAQTGWFLFGAAAPGQTLTWIPITSGSFVIGRRRGLDLTLASPTVSGRHAEILFVGENLFIHDLGSRNGTFVNRVRVEQPTPLGAGDHIELADVEFRLDFRPSLIAPPAANERYEETVAEFSMLDAEWMFSQMEELIANHAVVPFFQAIVDTAETTAIGYEALARSTVSGMEKPACMFGKAQLLNREVELSLLCRERAVSLGRHLPQGSRIFLNTHPRECLHGDVLPSLQSLQERVPDRRIVVEVHEGAVVDLPGIRRFIAKLKDLGIGIAYDDFGAGRSRLVELIQAPPDFLKFDIGLIRDIHIAPAQQQRMLKTLVEMVHEMGIAAIAEGLEKAEEADCCRDLGFDYLQGFLFGRPHPVQRLVPMTS